MVAERMEEAVGIGGHSGSGVDNGIVQARIGGNRRQLGDEQPVDGGDGDRSVIEIARRGAFHCHAGALAGHGEVNTQLDGYGRANRQLRAVSLKSGKGDREPVSAEG